MKTLRKTKARGAVETAIKGSHAPITSSDLIAQVSVTDPKINRATIFRIISKLLERDDILLINLGDGKTRYEWNGDHHHHLVCNKCKSITPLHFCDAESIARNEARNLGFQIHSHSLEDFGLCKNCK